MTTTNRPRPTTKVSTIGKNCARALLFCRTFPDNRVTSLHRHRVMCSIVTIKSRAFNRPMRLKSKLQIEIGCLESSQPRPLSHNEPASTALPSLRHNLSQKSAHESGQLLYRFQYVIFFRNHYIFSL